MTARREESPAPGWELLPTDRGHDLLARIDALRAAGRSIPEAASALRGAGEDPGLLAAALTQSELRDRAVSKFGPLARRMLFTRAGLEQATRAPVAERHAARFLAAGCRSVADLGCGLGAESLALLAAGVEPRPVELDPLTAAFAEHNLGVGAAAAAESPRVAIGDAEALGPGDADGVFLDPARRTAGHSDTRRISSPDDYSPSLGFAFALAERLPTGVKLGPGLDRDLIPGSAEAQWVSVDGQVVEAGLWFGSTARPGVSRAALVLRGAEPAAELTSTADSPDAEVRGIGEYLYEPDGTVIRARLIGELAGRLGAGMLSPGIAYLTSDRRVDTPFAQAFRIVDELPAGEKQLRRALADRGIGVLEIKKRGADVDPAALRRRLKLKGAERATLFLTRNASGGHIALLAERA